MNKIKKSTTLIEALIALAIITFSILFLMSFFPSSSSIQSQPVSSTGVKRAKARVSKGVDGLTVEQRNVKKRLEMDNKPGSIKHLYIISAFTGECVLYSTVKGKVTSSGKRLNPTTVYAGTTRGDYGIRESGVAVSIAGRRYLTEEVLQDDGTYGSSIPYLYWWDQNGKYHQQYLTGGMSLHISDKPISVKKTTIDLSIQSEKSPEVFEK